ncbi:MAG TPA: apolipoprotein N-acyltransferase [Frankiaceae bacterium]
MSVAVSIDRDAAPENTPTRPRRRRAATRVAAAAAGGLLLDAASAPVGWWPAAVLGVAVATLAVRGCRWRAAYGLGLVTAAAYLVPLLAWVRVIGDDAWLALAATQVPLVALAAPASAVAQRFRRWPATAAGCGCAWVLSEAIRGREPFGGFPWGRLAFSQASSPLRDAVVVAGVPAVTFLVAVVGGLLACGAVAVARAWGRGGEARPRTALAGAVVPLVAAAIVVGGVPLLPTPGPSGRDVTVAAVQGNVPRLGLDAFSQREAVLRNHVRETQQLAAAIAAGRRPQPDIVVWPENASDLDPFANPEAGTELSAAAATIGRDILVGAVVTGPRPGTLRNQGLLWGPDGYRGQSYTKQHLVPFGEYLPFRPLLTRLVGRFRTYLPDDFVPGTTSRSIDMGPVRVADVICYEVAYDGVVRDSVRQGGQVIVVQTNNATYGRTMSEQQLQMGRLRAVEHGMPVIVVATSGISAIIGPDGTVRQQTQVFTAASLVATVRAAAPGHRTLADRVGAWPELVAVVAGAALTLLPAGRRFARLAGRAQRRTAR